MWGRASNINFMCTTKTAPAPEVTVTNLQSLVEREKAALARAIHDDLGGYLIACAMDVTNLRHRFAAHDEDSRAKFDRLSKMLNGAIDMMRGVTEELHPTLLDNVGLFAALRWQIKHKCHRAEITCCESMPGTELPLSHSAAINLYRVGQEALVVAENHSGVQKIDFNIQTANDNFVLQVSADGDLGALPHATGGDNALGFLRHRVRAMGGDVDLRYPSEGGMKLTSQFSMSELLAKH